MMARYRAAMDNGHVRQFLVLDRIGAVAGLASVFVANGLFFREPGVWWVVPPLALLVGCLTVALRVFDEGRVLRALALCAGGNWAVALAVPVVLPMLWPVMVVTVLVQVVLAAPHVPPGRLVPGLVAAAATAALVALIGLFNDDGGALPDMDDALEVLVVVGSLITQTIPVAVLAWQNNRFTRDQLAAQRRLNDMLVESQDDLARSRRRVVEAGDEERRRIERDLHDGAQQRLVALGVQLGLAADRAADDDAELAADLVDLRRSVTTAVEEIRQLAQGIFPTLLRNQGLGPAVRAAARRSPQVEHVDVDDIDRLDETTESAMYFAAIEALTNAAKHAPDAAVTVTLHGRGNRLTVEVGDDGPGFDAVVATARGFTNIRDRLDVVGGHLEVETSIGGGTTVRATAPMPVG